MKITNDFPRHENESRAAKHLDLFGRISFILSCFGCVILAIGGISDENTVLVAVAIGGLIFSWFMKLLCQGLAEICYEIVRIRTILESNKQEAPESTNTTLFHD